MDNERDCFIDLPVKPVYHRPKLALIQLLQKLYLLSKNTVNGFLLSMNVKKRVF